MRFNNLGKKFLSGSLAALMALCNTTAVYAEQDDSADVPETVEENAVNDVMTQNGKVRVSIVLNGSSTIGQGYSTQGISANKSAVAYRHQLQAAQESVQNKISREVLHGEKLDVVWNITLAGNMISAWVPVESLGDLYSVDGVEDVIIETRYQAPKTGYEADQPNMTVSSDMTDSRSVWGNGTDGYTGAGEQVAIIDTGFDFDHQSFDNDAFLYSINELKSAGKDITLMSAQDIAKIWPDLNASKLNSSKTYTADQIYRNEKVPFGFNYVDNSLDITHDNDDQGDHGSHVSGIAAANRYIKTDDGKYTDALSSVLTQGQAPDAQVVVMKVFGSEGGAFDSDYMVAIEDAMWLGCEAINLSLGSTQPGFGRDVTSSEKRYNSIFKELENSDCVVNIAAGNSYNWADNASTHGMIYSDDVNFDMVGKPGSYQNAFTVASANNDGMTGYYVSVDGKNIFYNESKHKNEPLTTMAKDEAYDYVYIDGTATTDQMNELGSVVQNKIVVCKRGDITFVEKAENIAKAGGLAAFIANNTAGVISLDLSDYTQTKPVIALTQEDGNYFRDHGTKKTAGSVDYYEGKVVIGNVIGNFSYNSEYYDMSDFSSWGVPSALTIKPEITAPGGNIYSINGLNDDRKSYRNGSGTSMATPQVTGIAAVFAQYARDTKLDEFAKNNGLTLRALQHSLLMGTAVPMKDKNTGTYYPVIRQGAGLVNLGNATRANTLIVMDESASASAKDGKVKAELGEDANRTGSYTVSFKVYNTSDKVQSLDFSGDFFTQSVIDVEGTKYMDGTTTMIPSDITWYVDGKQLSASETTDVDAMYDFNGDGKYDKEDARAVLAYAVGKTDAIKSNKINADLDKDGDIDTYDAYLALNQSSTVSGASVPAKGSVTVQANVQISMPESLDDKGNYVEGYLFVNEASTAEGAAGVQQSIPVLGYYGSWTEPSMYEKGGKEEYASGNETRDPYYISKNEVGNVITFYPNERFGTELSLGANPFMTDTTPHPERAAISNGARISYVKYSLIRNASKGMFRVVDENGTEYYRNDYNTQYAAYYNSASTEDEKVENAPTTQYFNKGTNRFTYKTLANVPEGAKLRIEYVSAPEYYLEDDGTVNWDRLGDGARVKADVVMDSKAPEVVSVESVKDASGNTAIKVVAKDANYIAGAQLFNGLFTNLERLGAPEEQTRGGQSEFVFTNIGTNVSNYSVEIHDYAGNSYKHQFTASQLGIEEPEVTEETEEPAQQIENEEVPLEEETVQQIENEEVPLEVEEPVVEVPEGTLNSVTAVKTNPFVSFKSETGEVSDNGDTLTINLLTENNESTNGKYEVIYNTADFEAVTVETETSYADYTNTNGTVTYGFISELPLAADQTVGKVVLKAKAGTTGTVTVKTTEVNASKTETTETYSYTNGSFKTEEPAVKEENSWTAELTVSDITEGETVSPSASAKFGTVTYLYSTEKDGEYTETVPAAVGTYWVKAVVAEGETYTGLESEPVSFKINAKVVEPTKQENSWTTELTVSNVEYGNAPAPKAEAKFGEVVYKYADTADGEFTDTVPTTVGTHYVKAVVAETDEYTGLESDVKSFEITKLQNAWTVSLTMDDVYAGDVVEPHAEAKYGEVTYEYRLGWSGEWSNEAPTAASGTLYYVRAVVAESETYTGLTSEAVGFYINKRTNKWTEELHIANIAEGEALEPHAAAEHGEVTYTYYDSAYHALEAAPTAAGVYYVRASVAEDDTYEALTSSYVRFEITTKAKTVNNWITELTIANITYGETLAPNAEAAYGEVTYLYSSTANGEYTEEAPVNAGTYFVKAVVAESEEYTGLESASVAFKINKAANNWTVELTVADVTVGETVKPHAEAAFGDVSYLYSTTADGEFTTEVPTEVGTYFVKAVASETENHLGIESDVKSFEIKAKEKTANSWTTKLTVADVTYGEEVKPNAVAAFGTVTYLYAEKADGEYTETAPVNAGTYFVKAVVAEGETYTGLESEPVSFNINKASNSWTVELTVADVTEGEEVKPHAEASVGEVTYVYSATADGQFTAEVPAAVGTYFVKAVVAESENYLALESEAVSFNINAKVVEPVQLENSWVKELTVSDIKYGETPAPHAEAAYGEVRYEYRLGWSGTWSSEVPTEGSYRLYYVRAIVDETEEYTGLESKAVAFYIDPADNEWVEELTIADITEGETPEPHAAAKYGEVVYSYAKNENGPWSTEVPTEAGEYYVRASVEATDNYTALTASVKFSINAKVVEPVNPFIDVHESDYYYDPVMWAVEKGITSGTSKTTFSPEAECTRAQVATFLWRAAGSPEPTITSNPFTDVSDTGANAPYYKAILWAYEKGIASGTSKTQFSPDATCTRAQIVTFLYRYAGSPEVKTTENPFNDVENKGAMKPFYTPILWAVENGITSGTGKNRFSPYNTCDRGQVVTFLYRLLAE